MYNNINFNINNSNIYINGVENVDIQGVLPQNEVKNAPNLNHVTSEDELVEFNEFSSDLIQRQEELNLLYLEYTEKMNEYFRYQTELLELQRQYNNIQRQILNTDDEDKKKKLQSKAADIDVKISAVNNSIKALDSTLNDINAEIHSAMCDVSFYNSYDAQTVSPGKTVSGVKSSTSTAAQNVSYGPYSGNSIPKELVQRLDNRLGSGFSQKCEQVAAKLGCDTGSLLAMMYSESGLKTDARNKSSNAIGLIQFIPSTLKGNGYTTDEVANMNAVEQLDVVLDIFMKAKKMAGYGENEKIDGGTLYAINWLPAYAKKDTLAVSGGKYYSRGLDMNKDGSVTKADLSKRLQSKYNEMLNNI